ncbi:MAG: hypothetical protein JWN60_2654 [Acidobacteria bacterium]|nr:hypothetical protein [Acidobacteriota bacterium]
MESRDIYHFTNTRLQIKSKKDCRLSAGGNLKQSFFRRKMMDSTIFICYLGVLLSTGLTVWALTTNTPVKKRSSRRVRVES